MARTTQASTQLTEDEIEALKEATGESTIKEALNNAVQYRIAQFRKETESMIKSRQNKEE